MISMVKAGSITSRIDNIMPALHDAVRANSLSTIKRLLRQGADINATDEAGNTALMIAISLRHILVVNYFLECDPDLYQANNNGDIALSLAMSVSPELVKKLVIKHATESNYIEYALDDDNRTLENKLITTLLYKSKRHGWKSQDCHNLRYYLNALNPHYSNFSEANFNAYIRHQETQHRTFYGSYLSDDSDSDEENQLLLAPDVKRKQDKQASKLQQRGQLDRLFLTRASGGRGKGDFKIFKEASVTFDLKARAAISYGKHVDRDQVAQDLRSLNRLLAGGASLEEAQSQVRTRFFVAQYRGITHLTSKWNKSSRVAHRQDDEVGKAQYSSSVLSAEGIEIYKDYIQAREKIEQNKDSLEQRAQTLREILLSLREPRPCTYDRYSYTNYAYLLQNLYTQAYDDFHRLLSQDPLLQAVFFNGANPFLSTGDTPYHALKYAYGIKPYQGHEDERIRPRWQRDGRAERPYSGVTYVSLHPVTDYDQDGPLHLVHLNRNAEIKLKKELNIIAERESCFPAYLPEGRVIHKHVAKYPSFRGPYKEIYNLKYGITPAFYAKLQAKFLNAPPHSEEMTEFKKILGEWLCSYYEVKLIEKARKAAKHREGVLIYRDINGEFSLTPPIDSVNRNTTEMTEVLKSPVKVKQQVRSDMAKDAEPGVRVLEDEAEIAVIAQQMNLGEAGEFSVFAAGNSYLSIPMSLAINAIKEKRYAALQHFLSKPEFAVQLNDSFFTKQLDIASLPHMAVLQQDARALQLLLSCPQIMVVKADESFTEPTTDHNYYESLSPMALAIINGVDDMIPTLLASQRIDLSETVCRVANKDLIENLYIRPDHPTDMHYLGVVRRDGELCSITRISQISLLHLAVVHGSLELVTTLLQAGAPCNLANSTRKTPLDIALQQKKYDVATVLVIAGATLSPQSLQSIPREFRSYVANNDTEGQPRPGFIPEDIYNLLITMKPRFALIGKTSPGPQFFNSATEAESAVDALPFSELRIS